jgi:ribonuclease G
LFKSRYAIVTPDAPGLNISRSIRDDDMRDELMVVAKEVMEGREMGLILRSCCAEASAEEIAEDVEEMANLADSVINDESIEMETLVSGDGPHVLAWRDWTETAEVVTEAGGFEDHGVLDFIETVSEPFVSFGKSGGMYIEPTRALIAVDVNTGNDASVAAGVKANMVCARLLPQALRVRGLAGQITLDLAPMPKKDRRAFEVALRASFRTDDIETALVGWTPLGHYELQRKRVRLPLSEVLG